MKTVTLVAGIAIVSIASVGTVLAQVQAAKPTAVVDPRVLVPKTGAPAPSMNKPRSVAPAPAPVSAAEKSALVSSIQAAKPSTMVTPPSRTTFTVGPDDLKVNGTLTNLTFPTNVRPDVAAFELANSGLFNFGTLDGAWLVDCAVNTRGTNGAFTVMSGSFKDGSPTNVVEGKITAVNGHLLFGVYFSGGPRVGTLSDMKGGNAWTMSRAEAFDWYGCTLTPVN